LGALPTPTQIKDMQQQQNLKTVINLCAEFPGYRGLYGELNIHQLCLGTADYTVPTLDKIEAGVLAIMEIAEHGEGSVYIHCKGDVDVFLLAFSSGERFTNTFFV
jgi:atypical dual specificity phosphatase